MQHNGELTDATISFNHKRYARIPCVLIFIDKTLSIKINISCSSICMFNCGDFCVFIVETDSTTSKGCTHTLHLQFQFRLSMCHVPHLQISHKQWCDDHPSICCTMCGIRRAENGKRELISQSKRTISGCPGPPTQHADQHIVCLFMLHSTHSNILIYSSTACCSFTHIIYSLAAMGAASCNPHWRAHHHHHHPFIAQSKWKSKQQQGNQKQI